MLDHSLTDRSIVPPSILHAAEIELRRLEKFNFELRDDQIRDVCYLVKLFVRW